MRRQPPVPFALPHLTTPPNAPALAGSGQVRAGSQLAVGVRQRIDEITASRGAVPAHGYIAALWLLLQRYARYEDSPGELVVFGVPGYGESLLTGLVDPNSGFSDVVAQVAAALAVETPAALADRPRSGELTSAGVAVIFVWGPAGMPEPLPPGPRLVVRVDPDGSDGPVVRIEDDGTSPVLASAVESDYLVLLTAASGDDGAVADLDVFSTDPAASPEIAAGGREVGGLHDIVLGHAVRTPDAVAVRGQTALTYRELVHVSRQLCGVLVARGVGPQDRVGLCVERDEWLAVSLLGVLMSGAAFVPLSSEDPPLRRRELIADARISVIVATDGLADDLAGAVDLVRLEDLAEAPVVEPGPTLSSHAAYVLYTSGSSGKPKGVVVEHRQILAYAAGFIHRIGHQGPLTCAMVQPLTVDSSLTCVVAAWVTGGELQVIERATALDRSRFAAWQEAHPADVLKIAPSHLRALQESGDLAAVGPTVALVVGGEASDWRWLQRLQDDLACSIYNHYGPTETTVGVLMLTVAEHRGRPWATAPLGHPLAGCQVSVVDRFGAEAPAGVRGELVVRGPLVARGYQVEPAMSGFREWRGVPAYWTGDQGLRELDGIVCFAGRLDDQVKVRGFRVELGEIEQAVISFPRVRRAVALVSTDDAGWASVGCVVQPTGAGGIELEELAAHCRTLLPEHMVPTRWLVVAEVPRTPHGKLDRSALRKAIADRGTAAAVGAASPPTSSDSIDGTEVLAEVWHEVLGSAVAHHVNFFDAGGHSLLLLDLQRLIAARIGREVELLDLFTYTTIAAQAELLRSGGEGRRLVVRSGRRRRQEALARRRTQQLKRGDRDLG